MCFSHVQIKCTEKTIAPQRIVGYPPGPGTEATTDVCIYDILGFDIRKGDRGCFDFSSLFLYCHKEKHLLNDKSFVFSSDMEFIM